MIVVRKKEFCRKISKVITSQKSSREIEDFCENQFGFEFEIIISKNLVEKSCQTYNLVITFEYLVEKSSGFLKFLYRTLSQF